MAPDKVWTAERADHNRNQTTTLAAFTSALSNWSSEQRDVQGHIAPDGSGLKFILERQILSVVIPSPSDQIGGIQERVISYRDAGVPLIWVVDTSDRTVTIYRHGQEPTFVNVKPELTGEDVLPGFRVPAAKLFA